MLVKMLYLAARSTVALPVVRERRGGVPVAAVVGTLSRPGRRARAILAALPVATVVPYALYFVFRNLFA